MYWNLKRNIWLFLSANTRKCHSNGIWLHSYENHSFKWSAHQQKNKWSIKRFEWLRKSIRIVIFLFLLAYRYTHFGPCNFINQEFLPESIQGTTRFQPGDNSREKELRSFLSKRWKGKYGYWVIWLYPWRAVSPQTWANLTRSNQFLSPHQIPQIWKKVKFIPQIRQIYLKSSKARNTSLRTKTLPILFVVPYFFYWLPWLPPNGRV